MEKGGATMADMRLIDAEWLKRVIRQHIKEHPGYPIYEKVMVLVCEVLDDSPTADAAPVVWCRDCKWRNTKGCPYMNFNASAREDFDFCSDGERRN
jgi:hypothetical protein